MQQRFGRPMSGKAIARFTAAVPTRGADASDPGADRASRGRGRWPLFLFGKGLTPQVFFLVLFGKGLKTH